MAGKERKFRKKNDAISGTVHYVLNRDEIDNILKKLALKQTQYKLKETC